MYGPTICDLEEHKSIVGGEDGKSKRDGLVPSYAIEAPLPSMPHMKIASSLATIRFCAFQSIAAHPNAAPTSYTSLGVPPLPFPET